jgi:transcriptional regulator with XRE-family HTH domain
MPKEITAIDRHVARRIKIARQESGLSQMSVAERVGMTYQQLYKYENGEDRIYSGRLALLAHIFEKPIHWFFEGAPIQSVLKATASKKQPPK